MIARSITLGWRLHRYNIVIIVVVQIVLEMKALDVSGSPGCCFKRLLLAVMRYQVLGLLLKRLAGKDLSREWA